MTISKKKKNITFALISTAAIILFAVLAYLFPYSGDDWAWGSQLGIERLNNWFDGYNGRYAGNLLVIALTRVPVLKIAFMAVSYYLTCLFAYKYSASSRISVFIFSIAMFFTMPKEIFVQAVVWTSGYTNYVPPILMMIGYILLVKNIFNKDKPVYAKPIFVLTFILGFAGAMFMENLTLYSIAAAILVILYCGIKFKKAFLPHISYFVGTVAGAVMMFTNSSYGIIASNKEGDGYRSSALGSGNLIETIGSHLEKIYTQLFINNFVLLIILTVLTLALAGLKLNKIKKEKYRNLVIFCSAVHVFSLILILFKANFSHWKLLLESEYGTVVTVLFFTVAAGLYYISLSAVMLVCLDGEGIRDKALFLIISIPIIVAPLLVVNPIGPRNFFPPFMLMIMMAAFILENLLECANNNNLQKFLSLTFAAVIFASGIYYLNIYVPIHRYDTARNETAVEQSQENNEVTLCTLPYDSYVWYGNPDEEPWATRYKKFHGIDEQVQFEFVKYSDYKY